MYRHVKLQKAHLETMCTP